MTKHVIIDVANAVFRARHVARGDDPRQKAGMALHILLASVRKAWTLFGADHAVFAFEGNSDRLWRKAFYAPYKRNRIQRIDLMKASDMADAEAFGEAFAAFKDFALNTANAAALMHAELEADDLVAGWVQAWPGDEHVIVSSDSDFHQLVAPNVVQFNPVSNTAYRIDGIYDEKGSPVIDKRTGNPKAMDEPGYILFEKCVRGDPGDNVRPAYKGARRKGTKSKVGIEDAYADRHDCMFDWNNFMNHKWTDEKGEWHHVATDFARNRTLIDLTAQPQRIRACIDDTISSCVAKPATQQVGIRFLGFCGEWSLDRASSDIVEYGRMFGTKYEPASAQTFITNKETINANTA